MTLLDETTAPNSDSTIAVATEPEPTTIAAPPHAHAGESAATADPADEPRFAAEDATAQEIAAHEASLDEKPASEDFASALETFTTETEEAAAGADRVIKGTVLKLTGTHVVNRIVTELAVIDVTPDGLLLLETAPGVTASDVQKVTEPVLRIAADLKTISY